MNQIEWSEVENYLESLEKVKGGFSNVVKGLLKLPGHPQVFVKLATDPATKKWAKKEVDMYRFLDLHNYHHAPKLLAANKDHTGFVLEALTSENGWVWDDRWNEERLNATFAAMDNLKSIQITEEEKLVLSQNTLSQNENGWEKLSKLPELQTTLKRKLEEANRHDLIDSLDIPELTKTSKDFVFINDSLVHYDIRSDNCAWNPALNEASLIDWSWTQVGDTRIDNASLLVNVQKSGFDITSLSEKLDTDALLWMAGFWFAAASTPIWENGPENLRDFQLQSGIVAFDLAS